MRILSLFSGIGSIEKALSNIGLDYDLIGFSEVDKKAIETYCLIHNVNVTKNLGDIKNINIKSLPKDLDLICHGSPCQDFSKNGKGLGGDKNSNTRSSLLWNSVEIIKNTKPKYIIWENVRNVISKKHRHTFDAYIDSLENVGYTSHYKILNSKYFGVPQSRERVFTISIRNDLNKNFIFPVETKLKTKLMDWLDEKVDNKYYEINNLSLSLFLGKENGGLKVKQATKKGYDIAYIGDAINIGNVTSKTRRGRVGKGVAQTLITQCEQVTICPNTNRLRKLTPHEYWTLMGFNDDDFNKAREINSDTSLYKLAGNSIVVPVLEKILENLI